MEAAPRRLGQDASPRSGPELGLWQGPGTSDERGTGRGDENVFSIIPTESQQCPCPFSQNDSNRPLISNQEVVLVPKPGQNAELHIEASGTVRGWAFLRTSDIMSASGSLGLPILPSREGAVQSSPLETNLLAIVI